MQFRHISFGSSDYEHVLQLRDRVLRVPLGLSIYDEDLEAEKDQQAYGLFSADGGLRGCLMIAPLSRNRVKLRQMAIDPDCQRQGLGRELVLRAEQLLGQQGIQQIVLHARSSAVAFYRRLGYESLGPEFQEVGIPHQKMHKWLGSKEHLPDGAAQ